MGILMYFTFAFILICIGHYIADYVLQTDYQKRNKHCDLGALFAHTGVYSLAMGIIFTIILFSFKWGAIAGIVTMMFHSLVDYKTSPIIKQLSKEGDIKKAVLVMGLDQLLHMVQLIVTFSVLLNASIIEAIENL